MEVLGSVGIVVLLTAVVGSSVMGTIEYSRQQAALRQARTITAAYQDYLALGGEAYQRPVWASSTLWLERVASEFLTPLIYPYTVLRTGQVIGPMLPDFKADWKTWGSIAANNKGWGLVLMTDDTVVAMQYTWGSITRPGSSAYWGVVGSSTLK